MGQGPAKAGHFGLRTAYASGSVAGLTDAQLLERFMHRRDDGASFEALLARHGPMVLGVCRALLRDEHAADDAFQATFLVLVRRAGSVRVGDSLGRWLYGVAHKVAVQSRRTAAIRNTRERTTDGPISEPAEDGSSDPLESADLRAAIHHELARLPESSRAAIVLCHLEGLSHEEAAQRLGWPVGTVRSRLARGRDRLRDRLARRGLAPSVPILSLHISPMVPERLIAATGRAADTLIAGEALSAGIVPASVLTLTSGVLQTMFLTKLKIAALVIGSASALSLSGAFAYQASDKGKGESAAPARATEEPTEADRRQLENPLTADWKRAMDRLDWARLMQTKGYVSKAAVLDAINHAKALTEQVSQRLDKLQRDLEEPKTVAAPKAGPPASQNEEADPKRWRELAEHRINRAVDAARNSAYQLPKRPGEAADPTADELALQFRAALAARIDKDKLHRAAEISDADWRDAENLPLILAARIESRMQDLRDDMQRLEPLLNIKQANVNKAKAQLEVAKTLVARNTRLDSRIHGAVSDEDKSKANAELLVAEAELQIREAEVQEIKLLIILAGRRLDQFSPIAKMAKDELQAQNRQDKTRAEPQPAPSAAGSAAGSPAASSPKRSGEAVDSSADELTIQFRAALAAKASREKLYRSGSISDATWREAENLPLILAARIESRMEELRDELERLESQLKVKQVTATKAKAQVELARPVVVRTKRLEAQHVVSPDETATAETELLVAESQLQIRAAEIQETEVLIKQAKRRLDQMASISKMAKDALIKSQDRRDLPQNERQPSPPAEAK
jgi:RNA polymerase sigma factor (sigma-70 family)